MDPFLAVIADFDRLPVAGGVIELDGTITVVNVAATVLFGRPADQVVGRKAWDIAPGGEHIWSDVVANARVADVHGEITIATPSGPRHVHYIVALRFHQSRTVGLWFAIETLALPNDDDRAQRVESLGRVAGGIAHDFNNQLVAVLAEASSAREDTTLPEAVLESLRRIEAAAQRMALLTRQLLAYAGRGRFVPEVLDPDALLASTQEQLQRLVRHDATLSIQSSPGRAAVEADPTLLREVIVNLVLNASESMAGPGGSIKVVATVTPREGGQSWWSLDVIDDGEGMDARTVARIFDPFFTTKADRHGLGLSAVHGIVRRLGGEILVDSKLGAGTTFRVRLPLVVGATLRAPAVLDATAARATSLKGQTILVADDEPSVRSTIRRLLERRGATVVIVEDGTRAAERLLGELKFTLVLLDVMMPGLTGYQLLPVARESQPQARVMLMSGYADGARGSGGEDEPDAFLEKPFTAKQMDAAVDALLGR